MSPSINSLSLNRAYFLVAIPALMWGASLTVVWGVLTGICLLAALFVFAILKRLEAVAK